MVIMKPNYAYGNILNNQVNFKYISQVDGDLERPVFCSFIFWVVDKVQSLYVFNLYSRSFVTYGMSSRN